eukprot:c18611_g1_i1.p1 GENE.c18611_g1_i1~~c18611_g1_i1.p1  ORF type:complete len:685 (-),score=148.62 c18611_g1_i1:111-2165(-)
MSTTDSSGTHSEAPPQYDVNAVGASSSARPAAAVAPSKTTPAPAASVAASKAAEAAASGVGNGGADSGMRAGPSVGGARAGPAESTDSDDDIQLAHVGTGEPLDFISVLPNSKGFMKLTEDQDIFSALIEMDPELVSTFTGRRRLFKRKRVPPGHIGLGDNASRTLFFRPGAYTRIGIARTLTRHDVRPMPGPGERLDHGDVTYMHLREDQIAVIQLATEEYVVGQGRYLVRAPNHVVGDIVSLRTPGVVDTKRIIRESTVLRGEELVDEREEATEPAGSRADVGSVQVVRAEPGYVFAVQRGDGSVRSGQGVSVVRREEKFIDWLSVQRTTRTTEKKKYLTSDGQECLIKIQLQWRLVDGNSWIAQCRAFEGPYDFAEEKLDALVQDEIGRSSMIELEQQRLIKFDNFEASVGKPLRRVTRAVGVQLLSMEVRHLRFPRQDEHRREQQMLEAAALRTQRQKEYDAVLARQSQQQLMEAAEAELARQQNAVRRDGEIAAVQDQRKMAIVEAEAAQSLRTMQTAQERTRIDGATKLLQAENEAKMAVVDRERRAEAELRIAKLEAEAEFVRAEAHARSAMELARVLKDNPEYLRYLELEMNLKLEEKRIAAVGAFATNPNALVPVSLQREVLRINAGYDPSDYASYYGAPVPGAQGGAAASTIMASAASRTAVGPRPRAPYDDRS